MKHSPRGLLRRDVDPDVIMMICTAGHVDHGKTRLVKLLTGCNTDRLKTEQERGLTIELGFAPCFLGGNLCVGIVDVPGHEKFVRNMVSGVSGIDLTILVIAADDGIMPQTVEHMQIMELLGVKRGIVALTKTDLVDKDRVYHVTQDIDSFLKGTFLEGSTICPLSSETGEGYFDFYDILVERIRTLEKESKHGIFRMPIERVFSQKGFGTVVTGIPVDGDIKTGDEIELMPGNHKGRVRGIQRFLRDASEGGYGQCLALNIADFSKNPPVRGQVICHTGYLKPATIFNVRLRAVSGLDAPLRNAEQIKFHTGTSEEPGKIYLLDHDVLSIGDTGYATVAVTNPVAATMHDRFIIRRSSPAVTVAGGEILNITYSEHRPRKKRILKLLNDYETFFDGIDPASDIGREKCIEYFLLNNTDPCASVMDISHDTQIVSELITEYLDNLKENGQIIQLNQDLFVHRDTLKACLSKIESRIRRVSNDSDILSITIADIRKGLDWPQALWEHIQQDFVRRKVVTVRGSKYVLRGSVDNLPEGDRQLIEKILKVYEETAFKTPRPDDLPDILKAPQKPIDRLLQHLCNEGELIRLSKNVILSYTAFKKAQDLVVEIIQEKGVLNSADFKHSIDSTRKYALAILDYLDARKVTIRIQNDRKLAPNYEKNMQ